MTPLFHQGTSLPAFLSATRRAARGKRHQAEVARFLMDAEKHCLRLQEALRRPLDHPDAWRPGPSHSFTILDPKSRLITVVPFADRVVQHVLCAMMVPMLERYAIADSYACRVGKGQHLALWRARGFIRGAPWVLKGDITAYFASIPHEPLIELVSRRVRDAELLSRVARIVRGSGEQGRGLPIGALVSQHLANLYLGKLDHHLKDDLGVRRYLRYMDDFLVFGERDEVRGLLATIAEYVGGLGLGLNRRGSRVMPARDGVPFLGYRLFPGMVRVTAARWRRFRRKHAAIEQALAEGRMEEQDAAARVSSQFAHLEKMGTMRLRKVYLAGLELRLASRGGMGVGRNGFQPREPGGLHRERPAQPASRLSEQRPAGQSQQEPGFSGCEFSAGPPSHGRGRQDVGTGGPGLRSGSRCPGADQVGVQRPAGLLRGTESPVPGGGLQKGVATGPFVVVEGGK